jgi:hypothetical protein
MNEQTGRRWRLAFFGVLAASAAGVLTGLQPAVPQAKLAPVNGVTWVPDDNNNPVHGRLLGVAADGTLIESERRYAHRNDSWTAWRAVRQDKQ